MHTQEVTAYTQSDETAREPELQEYGALKGKILRNTAIIGLVGSSGLALYDTSYASSFALGALASIGYIALLAGSVEQVLLKCVCVRVYMHACIHACMHTCIHTCMHTYIHTYLRPSALPRSSHRHAHTHTHTHTHTYTHTHTHTHTHTGEARRRVECRTAITVSPLSCPPCSFCRSYMYMYCNCTCICIRICTYTCV